MIVLEHQFAEDQSGRSIDTPERIADAKSVFLKYQVEIRKSTRRATIQELAKVHNVKYLNQLKELSERGPEAYIDPELLVDHLSWPAACSASGAMLEAIEDEEAFVWLLSRPGSHHAGPDYGMGFCLVNHLAVGATAAIDRGYCKVAILDFDAHHGNGSEDIFRNHSKVMTLSTHQFPFFPGTGEKSKGNNINFPLPAKSTSSTKERQAISEILNNFNPEIILVEAGLDGHRDDTTSDLLWSDEEFFQWGRLLAEQKAKIIAEVGGGYHHKSRISALSSIVEAIL